MRAPTRKSKEKEEKGFYDAYAALSRTFRAWLVAYGVGAPVLLLSRDAAMDALKAMPDSTYVILAFLVGGLLQVLLTWLYKLSMWWAYLEETGAITKDSTRYGFADKFTNAYWIEGVVDLLAVALYAYGTARVLLVMAA